MNRIESSELIINPRGAVYHLDLRPDEIADNIITVGDPFRVEKVSRYFDSITHRSHHREFITHTGTINGKSISVISTGIGPDNIDIVLNELDALVNIDFNTRTENQTQKQLNIIRVGTSGSLQPEVGVDQFVASTLAIGLDNLMHFYPHRQNEEEQDILRAFKTQVQLNPNIQPYAFAANPFLLANMAEGCHAGVTVTCPGFYGPQGRHLRMGLAMPGLNDQLTGFRSMNYKILNFEMETSALYGMSKVLGHRCLSMSAIVANRIAKKFSSDADATVDRLIRHVLEKI